MLYIISYDLNKPKQNYSELYKILQKYTWWHYLDSTWIIESDKSADYLFGQISPHIDENDSLLIFKLDKDRSGWLPSKAWDWIRARKF